MKKIIFLFVGVALLGGCVQTAQEEVEKVEKEVSNKNSGYLDTLNTAQKNAKGSLEDSINKKNASLEGSLAVLEDEKKTMNDTNNAEAPFDIALAQTCGGAKITTNKGVVAVQFYGDKAPQTVANFCTLAQRGFYDGVIFHRVIEDFMIQGGDPTGTGTGGPGYKFSDELPQPGEYKLGSLAMANAGPNTNGSQFFIVSGPNGVSLPPLYSLFGEVTEGMEVVSAIQSVATGAADKPVDDIIIGGIELMMK